MPTCHLLSTATVNVQPHATLCWLVALHWTPIMPMPLPPCSTVLAGELFSTHVACRLSLRTLKDKHLAHLSVLLFCLNPASVFYSAAYTEAPYAAASLLGYWLLPTHHWAAVAAFVAASAARSNGEHACGARL
jgi:hypothetical protein